MKNVLRAAILCACAMLAVMPAAAQTATAAAPSAQDAAAKTNLYNKWLENRKGPEAAKQKVAYDAGKEYLTKYGADNDEYVAAVKKWVDKYEAAAATFERQKKCDEAIKQAEPTKNYAAVFASCKEIVAAEPENAAVLLTLSNVGFLNATRKKEEVDKSLLPDAITYTRRLAEFVEAGKVTPENFKFINPAAADKDTALAWLNYRLGFLTKDTSPDEAVNHFLKVAQGATAAKSDPNLYYYLAQAYLNGEYKKLSDDYKARFEGKEATDESRIASAKLEQVLDRIQDAYARAVALSTKTDAATVAFRDQVKGLLTELYKQRHEGSDAGLQEFIAASATRRMPLPSDPLPTPTPAPSTAVTPTPTP